eukprot:320156_1
MSNNKASLKYQYIIEHWCRMLLTVRFVHELKHIVVSYATNEDKFDSSFSSNIQQDVTVEQDGKVLKLSMSGTNGRYKWRTGFGSLIATNGSIYHWKIKMLKNANDIIIGVIENEKSKHANEYWWGYDYGYGYNSFATFFHRNSKQYGKTWATNDIIHVILDLRAYKLSFKHNDINCGIAAELKRDDTSYRLG